MTSKNLSKGQKQKMLQSFQFQDS